MDEKSSLSTKEYLGRVRKALGGDDYPKFLNLLKSYRSKALQLGELIVELRHLFLTRGEGEAIEGGKQLFLGFKRFLPSSQQEQLDRVLNSPSTPIYKSPRREISESGDVPVETCPICREGISEPYKAKCGHVCCYSCWAGWLTRVLECPICRNRTRIATLSPLRTNKRGD